MIDFDLWAECDSEENLQALKTRFDGLQFTLLSGRKAHCEAVIGDSDDNIRGLIVWVPEIGEHGRGLETLRETLDATEIAIYLYHCLLDAPDFRFAWVGLDAYKATSNWLFESVYTMDNGESWIDQECVISDELYQELGSPVSFKRFKPGYWWNKYKGENYNPFYSFDQQQLNELKERLLPW